MLQIFGSEPSYYPWMYTINGALYIGENPNENQLSIEMYQNEIDGNIPTTDVIVPTSPVENEGTTNVQQTINQLRERVGE